MGEGIPGLAEAYNVLFTGALIFLALMLVLCLIRAIIGPRVADRLVAVNMMGTIVMVIIAILALMLQEGYLGDICLIYAMISFLAVVVLTKVYMGVYIERENRLAAEKEQVGATSAVVSVGTVSAEVTKVQTAGVSQKKQTGASGAQAANDEKKKLSAENRTKTVNEDGNRGTDGSATAGQPGSQTPNARSTQSPRSTQNGKASKNKSGKGKRRGNG